MRSDFSKFGDYDQVGRALKELVESGLLVRMGYGVYAKAEKSILTGNNIPLATITEAGLAVMKKLGIEADVGKWARLNRDRITTQTPMRQVIAVSRPVTRKIYFGKKVLAYEKY